MTDLTAIDLVLLVLLFASLVLGWRKGLISQAASLLGVAGALIAARLWGADAGVWLTRVLGEPSPDDGAAGGMATRAVSLLGYAAVSVVAWLWIWLLARMLRSAIKVVLLGWVDSLGGAAFMCLEWCLVLSVTLNVYALAVPLAPDGWGPVACALTGFAPWLWGMLVDGLPVLGTLPLPGEP